MFIGPFRHRPRPNASRRATRRPALESLEARRVFAIATPVHAFREDDYSVSGAFSFSYNEAEYRKSMPTGTYSGAGHLTWTAPDRGTASFHGTATGQATDSVFALGSWRDCSSHTIQDVGELTFRFQADTRELRVTNADSQSVSYLQYTDLLRGRCGASVNPPWSFFFDGFSSRYTGSFDPATHLVQVEYHSAPTTDVLSAATPIVWTTTGSPDLALSARPSNGLPEVGDDWQVVGDLSDVEPNNDAIGRQHGGISVTVDVSGAPLKIANNRVLESVADIRLEWASNNSASAVLEPIPVSSTNGLWGVYWNSRQMQAQIDELPAAPAWARFVKVSVGYRPGIQEPNAANNTIYVPVSNFDAQNPTSPALDAGALWEAEAASILGDQDASRYPAVSVYAFRPYSDQGISVMLVDSHGGFYYGPTYSEEIVALAPGEVLEDRIHFLAIENGTFLDEAYRVVPIRGVNDEPYTEMDEFTSRDNVVLLINPADLVRNDVDYDRGDRLRVAAVGELSSYGAKVRIRPDGMIEYDPRNAEGVRRLNTDEDGSDYFEYEVIDRYGARAPGYVQLSLQGVNDPPVVVPRSAVAAEVDQPVDAFWVQVRDWETNPDADSVRIETAASNIVSQEGIQVYGWGTDWQVAVTPNPGEIGRTQLNVVVALPDGGHGAGSFFFVVGPASDADLDGVPSETESQTRNDGDSNSDGIPDSRQPDVAAILQHGSAKWWFLESSVGTALADLTSVGVPTTGSVAAQANFPGNAFSYRIHVQSPGDRATWKLSSDLTDSINALFQVVGESNASDPTWQWLMWNGRDGARIGSNGIELVVQDGGRGDLDGTANGIIVGFAVPAHVELPWHNRVLELDVDNDGAVVPLDALQIINYINAGGEAQLPELPSAGSMLDSFWDTSGDNFVSPQDALLIINELNAASTAEGEGRSELPSSQPTTESDAERVRQLVFASLSFSPRRLPTRPGKTGIFSQESRTERVAISSGQNPQSLDPFGYFG